MGIFFKIKNLFSNNKDEKLYLHVRIEGFEDVLVKVLEDEKVKEFWNDVKKLYGKNVDERELFKVFKFYLSVIITIDVLERTKTFMRISNLLDNRYSYAFYKEQFNGKLDEKKFKELVEKIWDYHSYIALR